MKTLKEKFGQSALTREQMREVKGGGCNSYGAMQCYHSAVAVCNTRGGGQAKWEACFNEGANFCDRITGCA